MAIKGCKSIAEYAIRKWMEQEGFASGYFVNEMNGNECTITDRNGEKLIVEYDPSAKDVFVKE